MVSRTLYRKVGRWFSWTGNFGADAGVRGGERPFRQCWPVTPYRLLKRPNAICIDTVIDSIDPFDIGTKPHPATEIERSMNPKAGFLGHGIDQMFERSTRAA